MKLNFDPKNAKVHKVDSPVYVHNGKGYDIVTYRTSEFEVPDDVTDIYYYYSNSSYVRVGMHKNDAESQGR